MSKNRTNSTILFTDVLKNFHFIPETPIIPNIRILSEPAVLIISSNCNFQKEKNLNKKKNEIKLSTLEQRTKNEKSYQKLIEKMCFEIKMRKKEKNSRRRVFSDMVQFRRNKNSIFSFLEKRTNKL